MFRWCAVSWPPPWRLKREQDGSEARRVYAAVESPGKGRQLMVALYAICTVLGVVALLIWITLGIAASAGDDRATDLRARLIAHGRERDA